MITSNIRGVVAGQWLTLTASKALDPPQIRVVYSFGEDPSVPISASSSRRDSMHSSTDHMSLRPSRAGSRRVSAADADPSMTQPAATAQQQQQQLTDEFDTEHVQNVQVLEDANDQAATAHQQPSASANPANLHVASSTQDPAPRNTTSNMGAGETDAQQHQVAVPSSLAAASTSSATQDAAAPQPAGSTGPAAAEKPSERRTTAASPAGAAGSANQQTAHADSTASPLEPQHPTANTADSTGMGADGPVRRFVFAIDIRSFQAGRRLPLNLASTFIQAYMPSEFIGGCLCYNTLLSCSCTADRFWALLARAHVA